MIYRLYMTSFNLTVPDAATTVGVSPEISFLFDPNNSYYEQFKQQINADEAQLEDADGNLMTAEQAKAYVATLP